MVLQPLINYGNYLLISSKNKRYSWLIHLQLKQSGKIPISFFCVMGIILVSQIKN